MNVRYTGRFDFSKIEGPEFAWSGSTVSARFCGTSVYVKLSAVGENYFIVLLDGKVIIEALHVNQDKNYKLATELIYGEHEVSIIKRTEFYLGKVQFLGFDFKDGSKLPASKPLDRKIEFIGDSLTCGFGMEAENENVEYEPKYDNAYLSYGAITARALKAECNIIGFSGLGLIRKYDGDITTPMPSKYNCIAAENEIQWDFKAWIPQVVVINLGTNDFSGGFIPDRDEFVQTYISFINRIQANYPGAKIICTIGPVIEGEALSITREYIEHGVVEHFYNGLVSFFEFEHQSEKNGYGVTKHPSVKTHELMAKELSLKISELMNW